jgi:glycosyltransferase involved in cell wall biosynthesis
MRIHNLMFGKGRGGLEQAALDYHRALAGCGHTVTSLLHKHAAMRPDFLEHGCHTRSLSPLGEWDPLATQQLLRYHREDQPDVTICHGNRAIGLALRAARKRFPVIGVAHNYKIQKRFPQCDAVFSVSRDLTEEMVHLDIPRNRLATIPNMVELPPLPPHEVNPLPVIGTMGRFVPKKGFDVFLHALKGLKDQGVAFRAVLGGGGPEELALRQLASQLGLQEELTFTGWVEDKAAFFGGLDMFVLPSHHEPFGIVLLEAMSYGLPCVSTESEGPCEIVHPGEDALMVEVAHPHQMAHALKELCESPQLRQQLGGRARHLISEHYTPHVVAAQLDRALQQIMPLLPEDAMLLY